MFGIKLNHSKWLRHTKFKVVKKKVVFDMLVVVSPWKGGIANLGRIYIPACMELSSLMMNASFFHCSKDREKSCKRNNFSVEFGKVRKLISARDLQRN